MLFIFLPLLLPFSSLGATQTSPAAELLAKTSQDRLREIANALANGFLTESEAEAQSKAVVKRLGPPANADRSSLNAP